MYFCAFWVFWAIMHFSYYGNIGKGLGSNWEETGWERKELKEEIRKVLTTMD